MVCAWTVNATNKGFEAINLHKIYRNFVPAVVNLGALDGVSKRVAKSAKLIQFLHVSTIQGSPVYSNLKKSDPDPYLQSAIAKTIGDARTNK